MAKRKANKRSFNFYKVLIILVLIFIFNVIFLTYLYLKNNELLPLILLFVVLFVFGSIFHYIIKRK